MIRWLFTMMKHKINNTGWIWNGDETEGWNEAKPKRECRTFFNLHFLDQKWSKDLEFALAKLRGLCKYLANVYNSHSHVLRTPPYYFVHEKQGRKINAMRRVVLQKSSALSQHKIWRSLLTNWIYYIAAKTTTSLWNEMKGKTRKMQSD